MTDSHVADQAAHVARPEHVTYQTGSLVHEEAAAVRSGNARSVLSPMLQHLQTVIEELIDRRRRDDSNDSTHADNPI